MITTNHFVMIIALDGNVFSGKTTLIKKIAKTSEYERVNDHSDYLRDFYSEPSNYNSAKALQDRYLAAERERKQLSRSKKLLLDRSFVSMSAHVYAQAMTNSNDIRDWYLSKLESNIKANNFLVPELYIFTKVKRGDAIERYKNDSEKQTPRRLLNKHYFTMIDRYNKIWVDKFEGLTLNTSQQSVKTLRDQVIQADLQESSTAVESIVEATRCIFQNNNS